MRAKLYISLLAVCVLTATAQAQTGDALRQAHKDHREGFNHHIRKDYDSALEWYKKAASIGLAKSEYGIGRILAFDREGQHDYENALPWIIRAAGPRTTRQGQGFIETQIQAAEALEWYCNNGPAIFPQTHAYAQDPRCWHGRAKALRSGWFSVEKDETAARSLLEKSIAAEWSGAQTTLDKMNRKDETLRKSRPKDWKRTLFVLFMMMVAAMVMRSLRVRQFVYGLLYRHGQ